MATLYDSGVWLALTFTAPPHHALAIAAHAKATRRNPACFCRATQQSFLRLATTPAILRAYGAEGLSNREALQARDALMRQAAIRFLDEPAGLQALWHQLAGLDSTSPKVWMDAYLAAFAIRHDAALLTLDRDFLNFKERGLKVTVLAG